jgi:beta-glucosidase-like glycosyl hydrolase
MKPAMFFRAKICAPQIPEENDIAGRASSSALPTRTWRDPRWGRSEESYGEDPYLTGTMPVAFVRGLQGDDPHYWLTASLMKHFLANSNEDGRGGSRAYMTAYNAYNGIPMAAQPVLRDLTMHEWGFDGIICTDAGALTNMVTQHKYFPEINQATAGAIHAGINQFLDQYSDGAIAAVEKKFVNLSEIDEKLRGVYRVMIRLGLLDPPDLVLYSKIKGTTPAWDNEEHKALARKITQESIVLLKNDDGSSWIATSGLAGLVPVYADKVTPQLFYAFSSSSSGSAFYCGTVNPTAGTAAFTQVNTTVLPASANCYGSGCGVVDVNFGKPGDIWLPLGSNGLYHSTDDGVTWANIANVSYANSVAVGAASPRTQRQAVFLYGQASPLNL